jgi:Leucine-rich repeat (LRR) protein
MKNPSFDLEEKRVELAFAERNVQSDHAILDLSGFEFNSINGIQNRCPQVTQLNISNNNLKSLEVNKNHDNR